MCLQVQVLEQDKTCLRFLTRPMMNKLLQVYEYQRHLLSAKSSPTCANCALKQMAIVNEDESPIAVKANQKIFNLDDFIKAVDTPEEAINVFKHCNFFSQNIDLNWKIRSSTDVEWPKKSLRTWHQSATQSNRKRNLVRWIGPCLDFNGLLLKIICKIAKVLAKKLKDQSRRWRSCFLFHQYLILLNCLHHSVFTWDDFEEHLNEKWTTLGQVSGT